MFKNPFSFNGRIRRTEYGLSFLIYFIISVGIEFLTYGVSDDDPANFLLLIVFVPLIWFMLAQAAKRCHDRGNSGWYQLIPFYTLWMLFADSDYGNNEYGPNPKGIGNTDEVDEIGDYLKK